MYQPDLPPKELGRKTLISMLAIFGTLVLSPLALGGLMFPGKPSIKLYDYYLSADRSHFEMAAFSNLPGIKTVVSMQKFAHDKEKTITAYLLTDSGTQTVFHVLQDSNGKDAAKMIKTTIFDRLNPGVSYQNVYPHPWHYNSSGTGGSLKLMWDNALLIGVFDPSGRKTDPASFVRSFGVGEVEKKSGPLGIILPKGWLDRNLVWFFSVNMILLAILWVVLILRSGLWVVRIAPPKTVIPEPAGLLREAIGGISTLNLPITMTVIDERTWDIRWEESLTHTSCKGDYAQYRMRLRLCLHPAKTTVKSVYSTHYREKRGLKWKWEWSRAISLFQYTRMKKPALVVKDGRIELTGNSVNDLHDELRNVLIEVTLSHGWTWQPALFRA